MKTLLSHSVDYSTNAKVLLAQTTHARHSRKAGHCRLISVCVPFFGATHPSAARTQGRLFLASRCSWVTEKECRTWYTMSACEIAVLCTACYAHSSWFRSNQLTYRLSVDACSVCFGLEATQAIVMPCSTLPVLWFWPRFKSRRCILDSWYTGCQAELCRFESMVK